MHILANALSPGAGRLVRAVRVATAIVVGTLAIGCSSDASEPTISMVPPPPPPPASPVVGLWTASGAAQTILRLSPDQLTQTGPLSPATTITTASTRQLGLVGLAFDETGNLWLVNHADSLLLMFRAASLAASGPAAATVVIHPNAESLRSPTGLAFDGAGRLWVANRAKGTLVRYDPPQLAASGAPVPAATLTLAGLAHPTSLAFDAAGSLWMSDAAARKLLKLTADQLDKGSGQPVPSVVIGAADLALQEPLGIAFDGAGNLWVANIDATVAAYAPDQLSVSGEPAPRVVLSSEDGSLALPVGLAFDAEGSLWVVGGTGTLARFGPAKLAASGDPPADALLELPGQSLLWGAAFWPRPAGLPLIQGTAANDAARHGP